MRKRKQPAQVSDAEVQRLFNVGDRIRSERGPGFDGGRVGVA